VGYRHFLLAGNDTTAEHSILLTISVSFVSFVTFIDQSPDYRIKTDPRRPRHAHRVVHKRWTLSVIVGRTKLTTVATVDVPWRNLSRSRVWNKVPERSLFLEIAEFLHNITLTENLGKNISSAVMEKN